MPRMWQRGPPRGRAIAGPPPPLQAPPHGRSRSLVGVSNFRSGRLSGRPFLRGATCQFAGGPSMTNLPVMVAMNALCFSTFSSLIRYSTRPAAVPCKLVSRITQLELLDSFNNHRISEFISRSVTILSTDLTSEKDERNLYCRFILEPGK